MIITLDGDPVSKIRPRIGKWGAYDPQEKIKKQIKKEISRKFEALKCHDNQEIAQEAREFLQEGHFDVDLIFCMPIAQSAPKSKKNGLLWNCIDNDSNKDCDNLEKFYLDCAQGILYSDDRYVISLKAKKISSEKPKVIFMIKKRKTLSDEICGILGIFSRNEMASLLEDLEEIYLLYDVDPKEDWVLDAVGPDDEREVRLSRTAYLLSKIAEHADKLKQIKRNFGGFHQRCKAVMNVQ